MDIEDSVLKINERLESFPKYKDLQLAKVYGKDNRMYFSFYRLRNRWDIAELYCWVPLDTLSIQALNCKLLDIANDRSIDCCVRRLMQLGTELAIDSL